MLETYENFNDIGYSWEDNIIEEHCASSKRHDRHERRQTGENSSVYTQCDKAFENNSYLQSHERKHTGEKSYECNQCGKAFAYHSYLLIHQRRNRGEKTHENVVKPFLITVLFKCIKTYILERNRMNVVSVVKPFLITVLFKCI
ncbi:zinc finger protein 431-like [Cricetulus griseus]|uniref:Zinc finger protein 431-like n=1 Tax=Cricetulus griseus TaxID=10029 RepID=A0A9J7HH27_CRIGR|nr:zinc finger protein 431-like [Cricetulus griseus]